MLKILRYLLLGLLVLVALVVGAVSVLLFTQFGRDVLVRQVNRYMATLATPVVVGRVSGNVLHDVQLDSLTVADVGGVWLTVDGVRLVWHPLALLDKLPPFELLSVRGIEVARLPVVVTSATEVKDEGGAVNPLDYMVYVPRNLMLDEVKIGAPVTGIEHRLRAEIATVGGVQSVSVSTLKGPLTTVSGTVQIAALDAGAVDLTLNEAPRGLVGGLLQLPEKVGIAAHIQGQAKKGVVGLEIAEVTAGQSHVVAQGEGALDGSRIRGALRLAVGNLADWQKLSGNDIHGAVYGNVLVSGSLAALGVNVEVSRTDVAVGTTRLAGAAGAVSGTLNVKDFQALRFAVSGGLKAVVSGVGQGAYPLTLAMDASGTRAAFDTSATLAMVRTGERADVRVGGAVMVSPLTVSGTVVGAWVKGKNTFTLQGGVESDTRMAVLHRLRLVGPGVEVSASGKVDVAAKLADGAAAVRVADFGPLAALAGVNVKGGMDSDVVLAQKAGLQTADATVRRFEVEYLPYKAVLKQPARLVWDGRGGSLSALMLDVAGGTLTAQGQMSEQRVNAQLAVHGVDIEQLIDSDVLPGRVDVTAGVTGTPAAPVVVVNGSVSGTTGGWSVEVKVQGSWKNGQLVAQGQGTSREASATANVAVKGGLSLLPFKMGIGPESAMSGGVTAHVPLGMFNTLLWASRQQVSGTLAGSATLGGKVGAPLLNGKFTLQDGAYSQSTSGICLQHVGAEIVGSNDRVELRNLMSNDGHGGTLEGKGSLGLAGAKVVSADIGLHHLQLFCGGLATGQIDGGLTARGTLADQTLAGKLTLGPLNIQIPGNSTETDIPQVETVRVKTGGAGDKGMATVTRLDIAIDAPRQIYVRGRGMDAEFGGSIAVSGLASAPQLNGSLKALRGTFTLLDRTLQLADSSVQFEGPMPPSPFLAVKATTTAQGTTIVLNVTGTATKPALALTTDPSLPQDEALALLLFGRSLTNISPFEALKLAQATRVLAGLDSGEPGILDKARDTLGVDTLDIGSGADSGDVTVKTGKYLTDKIYVSVQQGAQPEDRQVKTEVELTPSVSGNTTVDGEGNQSFGLEWKRDY